MPKRVLGKTIRTRTWLKRNKKSSTPGKTKVLRCQATPEQRAVCRRSRSYKMQDYEITMNKIFSK